MNEETLEQLKNQLFDFASKFVDKLNGNLIFHKGYHRNGVSFHSLDEYTRFVILVSKEGINLLDCPMPYTTQSFGCGRYFISFSQSKPYPDID